MSILSKKMLTGLWQKLGPYKSLPVFFTVGAVFEWFMINVRIGKETFCKFKNIMRTS